MECPDPECHDTVVRLSFFMKLVGSVVTALVTIGLALCLFCVAAEKKQSDHINEHHTQIKVIEKDIKTIKEDQRQMNESIKRIEKRQFTKSELIGAIKEAIKK